MGNKVLKVSIGHGSIIRDSYYLDLAKVEFRISSEGSSVMIEIEVSEDKMADLLLLLDNLGCKLTQ